MRGDKRFAGAEIEVVLPGVFPNNTDTAHLGGRMLPSIWKTTAASALMEQAFSDPPHDPQGGN
jgi:hypothetical protein